MRELRMAALCRIAFSCGRPEQSSGAGADGCPMELHRKEALCAKRCQAFRKGTGMNI